MQVHTEETCNNHQRQRQGAVDRQNFHHLVRAIGHGREIDIERAREQVALGFDEIHCAHQVVVDVAKIGVKIVTGEAALATNDGIQHVAHA